MPPPHRFSVHIEGGDLAVAEPRVPKLAVGHRTGSCQVAFLVHLGWFAFYCQLLFPELVSVGSPVSRHDEDNLIVPTLRPGSSQRCFAQLGGVSSAKGSLALRRAARSASSRAAAFSTSGRAAK